MRLTREDARVVGKVVEPKGKVWGGAGDLGKVYGVSSAGSFDVVSFHLFSSLQPPHLCEKVVQGLHGRLKVDGRHADDARDSLDPVGVGCELLALRERFGTNVHVDVETVLMLEWGWGVGGREVRAGIKEGQLEQTTVAARPTFGPAATQASAKALRSATESDSDSPLLPAGCSCVEGRVFG